MRVFIILIGLFVLVLNSVDQSKTITEFSDETAIVLFENEVKSAQIAFNGDK